MTEKMSSQIQPAADIVHLINSHIIIMRWEECEGEWLGRGWLLTEWREVDSKDMMTHTGMSDLWS